MKKKLVSASVGILFLMTIAGNVAAGNTPSPGSDETASQAGDKLQEQQKAQVQLNLKEKSNQELLLEKVEKPQQEEQKTVKAH